METDNILMGTRESVLARSKASVLKLQLTMDMILTRGVEQ